MVNTATHKPNARDTGAPATAVQASWWTRALRRFRRNRVSMAAATVLFVMMLLSAFAPLITTHDPARQYRREGLVNGMPVGSSAQFLLGTDSNGRDMFTRLLYGGRAAFLVGIVASVLAVGVGVIIGSTAGITSGWVDLLLMRIVDVALSLPTLFVILMFVTLTTPGLWITIVVIALIGWAQPSRVFRSEVASLREREYVLAARGLGMTTFEIFARHVIPHLIPIIVIYFSLGIPAAIFAEATLGFLGLGVPPPQPSWGSMVQEGMAFYRASPAQIMLPGAAIVLTVVCFNLVGSGLRDALDPTVQR
jgi:peptide/nickel transport system permease protein